MVPEIWRSTSRAIPSRASPSLRRPLRSRRDNSAVHARRLKLPLPLTDFGALTMKKSGKPEPGEVTELSFGSV